MNIKKLTIAELKQVLGSGGGSIKNADEPLEDLEKKIKAEIKRRGRQEQAEQEQAGQEYL